MAADKFKITLAIFWSALTIYFLLTLFPPLLRFHQWQEARFKGVPSKLMLPPSWLQRFVFVLLASLMTFELFANAFHQKLTEITGVGSQTIFSLTLILPALYFVLGLFRKTDPQIIKL